MELMTTVGDISVWDGNEIDYRVHESNVDSEIWNDKSVKKLSSRKKQI
jgi:hypothetical protein